jgi:Tfp pilus assembly protein PilF
MKSVRIGFYKMLAHALWFQKNQNPERMYLKLRKYTGWLVLIGLSFCLPAEAAAQAKNQAVEQKLTQAAAALSAGDLSGSEKILLEVLQSAPRNSTAQTLAGIIADRKNELPKAEKHFAAAARLAPNSPEARNNYGAILLRLSRRAEAAREFTASLAINPQQASALVNLAQIRFTENNLRAAADLFEKAKAIQPDAEIVRALVIIFLRMKETEKAKTNFAEYFPLAKDAFQQSARTELGAILLAADLATEAARELEAALALDSSNINTLVLLSRAFLQQKNIPAAGKLLESAVASGMTDAKIYLALAEVYQAGGYLENAIPAMRLAIEKDPKNDFYQARYGLLLIDSKAPAAAIIRLTEAVKEFPNSAKLQIVLGIAQQADGKPVEARSSFARALEIEPTSVTALAYMATSLIEQAQYAEAVKMYEKALATEENNAILHYLLADALLKIPTSSVAQIEKHLARSVQLDAQLAQAHLALGKLYVRAANWQQSAVEFEQATRYAPELPEAYYLLGRSLARLKRNEESKAAIDKYKLLNETQTAKKKTDHLELVRRLANVRF